jgi:hypothetical protein
MLNFPNASRSYDPSRHCVRFWGHDGALEVSFSVSEGALLQLAPRAPIGEMSMLESFDKNRERILAAAHKVYQGRRKGSYDLDGSDFE